MNLFERNTVKNLLEREIKMICNKRLKFLQEGHYADAYMLSKTETHLFKMYEDIAGSVSKSFLVKEVGRPFNEYIDSIGIEKATEISDSHDIMVDDIPSFVDRVFKMGVSLVEVQDYLERFKEPVSKSEEIGVPIGLEPVEELKVSCNEEYDMEIRSVHTPNGNYYKGDLFPVTMDGDEYQTPITNFQVEGKTICGYCGNIIVLRIPREIATIYHHIVIYRNK